MKRPLIIAVVALVVVIAAIVLNRPQREPTPPPEAAREEAAPAEKAPPPAAKAPAKAAVTGNAEPAPAEAAAGITPPSFDVVRITPGGETVIAGRARPGSRVVIRDGERELGEVSADARGEWVWVPAQPLAPGDHRLELEMRGAGSAPVPSEEAVVIAVPEPGKDITGQPAAPGAQALAMKVPRSGKGPSTILQKPLAARPPATAGPVALAIDSIDYDDSGRTTITGRAPPGAAVRLYLGGGLLGEARAGAGGVWRLAPEKPLAVGLYTLRADQLAADGKVAARIEIPFARSAPLTGLGEEEVVIIQPGNTLWQIARRTYGSGFAYTVIYAANREQIKDPDLIYPGQIFTLPKPDQGELPPLNER